MIKKAILKNSLGFRDVSDSNRSMYAVPKSLIEFEIYISHVNMATRQFETIEIKLLYCGLGWKWIPIDEIFDYPLPDNFKQFVIFNMDLFSKQYIYIDEFLKILEESREVNDKEEIDESAKTRTATKRGF